MSSRPFEKTMARFAHESAAVARIEEMLRASGPLAEFTFQHFYVYAQPSSPEALALILQDLTSQGVLHRVFRVESPSWGGGLGDYETLQEIPPRVHDLYTEE